MFKSLYNFFPWLLIVKRNDYIYLSLLGTTFSPCFTLFRLSGRPQLTCWLAGCNLTSPDPC